jgi:lipoprotein NlpD
MNSLNRRFGFWLTLGLAVLALSGCGSKRLNRAPVEDRQTTRPASPVTPGFEANTASPVLALPLGFENAGKPGFYTVKPGDTLLRISLENGQSMKDVARWSHVDNPNRIEVGQVLRIAPPLTNEVATKPVTKSVAVAAPVTVTSPTAVAPLTAASTSAAASAVPALADGDVNWQWPAIGTVLAGFDEVKNKGVDIGGNAGEPVLASADGRVVYVGAGLRGYGNLIILKHNNVFLTAYAHNQTLLVKEDQSVIKGQKIAEMGNSDADRVKLHFEVRRQGKPVDPLKYLPPR